MATDWTVINDAGTASTITLADTQYPYPMSPGVGVYDADGTLRRIYPTTSVREVRLATLPATGAFTWTVTRVDTTGALATPITVGTADASALDTRDENYYCISNPQGQQRRVIFMIRSDRLRSIVQA